MSDVFVVECEAGVVDGEGVKIARWSLEPERGQVDRDEIEELMRTVGRAVQVAMMDRGSRWATVHCWWENRGV